MESLDEVPLSAAVLRALKEAEARRDELWENDPKRAVMEQFLMECTPRLSKPDVGERPRLPDQRRGFVAKSESDLRRPSRKAAYTAMEALVAAAWPRMSVAERQEALRKQHRLRYEAKPEAEPTPKANELLPEESTSDEPNSARAKRARAAAMASASNMSTSLAATARPGAVVAHMMPLNLACTCPHIRTSTYAHLHMRIYIYAHLHMPTTHAAGWG